MSQLRSLTRGDDEMRTIGDVSPILEQALRVAATEIRHRATVVRHFAPGAIVRGSPARLGQLFLNLLVNAAHAIPEGAVRDHSITVRSRVAHDTVIVDITDTGVGIAPEHVGRIFDPFFTTKDIGSGSGLGLSICKGIVEEHGGTLGVVSTPGSGSTFTITLPRVDAEQVTASLAVDSPPARRLTVLVVDDEPLLLDMLARILSRRHEVVTVANPQEALELLLKGSTFDVILCDLMMKDVTGMDIQEAIGRVHPALARRMIFMTGGAFTPRAVEFVSSTPNPVVTKPFDFLKLLQAIDHVSRFD